MAVLKRDRRTWLTVVLGLLMVGALAQYAFVDGDTSTLLDNAEGILRCLREDRALVCPAGGLFPPFQLLLAIPLRSLGVSRALVGLFLARLSIVAFLGVLAITWSILRARSRAVATMAVLVIASGLPLHYANRSFGEMAAAFLTLAFAASWLKGKTVVVGATAFLAALTKEPAFLFISLLGFICAVVRCSNKLDLRELWRGERARFGMMAIGSVLAVLVSMAFNLFRFGVPYNAAYLDFVPIGPPFKNQLNLFVALWLAPNAGLVFFWPLLVIAFLSIPFAVRKYSSSSGNLTPFWGVALLLALITAICSGWWAPFGWWAWGQRLTVPWLPASLLVLCFAYSREIERLILRWLRTPARAALLTTIVIVVALPHVASVFRSDELIHGAFSNHPDCSEPTSPETRGSYYRCVEALAWTEPSPLVHAYRVLLHPFVRLRALIYAALLVIGGTSLYRAAREQTGLLRLGARASPGERRSEH